MGGFAGHMNHLYDNPGLTFKKMKDIFAQASNGELEGTEKTDGQNLFVSYSVQTGQAKGVRNKGEILAGGMNAEQLALKFAGHANPNIKEVFVESFDTFEKAVQSLDPELQIKIFGPDANVFYNSEIQDPRTRNVIAYDEKLLNIHQVGHVLLDKESKQIKTKGFEPYYRELDRALEIMQSSIQEKEYNVQKNAVRRLRALDDDLALNMVVERLENELRKVGISDNQTVFDYLMEKIISHVDQQIPSLPDSNKKLLLKRLFKDMEPKFKGITFNHVVKGLDKEIKESVRSLLKNEKNILKLAILPIEDLVHDFSVEMLKGLESFFVLDNVKEVTRLRSELTKAISAIEKSGNEDAIRILNKEMKKLKKIEGVTTAVEGFVFDYDGVTYKFTGNFAPANQILGLFKYGRKGIPALEFASEEREESDIEGCKKTHIIYPGAFKPPHRGHYNLVKHYSDLHPNGIIKILVSPLAASERKGFDSKTQADVSVEDSIKIWKLYTSDMPNVEISVSEMRTPVKAAYEYVGKDGPLASGECVLPASSNKGGDEERWKSFMKNSDKYVKPGVQLIDPIEHVYKVREEKPLHASDFRTAMKNKDIEAMKKFLPTHLQEGAGAVLDTLGLSPAALEENKKKRSVSSIIYGLVEEILNERDYQKESERIKDYLDDWREFHGTGPQDPGSAYPNPRSSKRSKSGPPGFAAEDIDHDEEVIEEDEIEETNAVEFVAGAKSYEQACYEDPNCRDLQDKKKKIKISISSLAVKELEEISTAGGGGAGQSGNVEGAAGSPWIKLRKRKKRKTNEQLINEVLDYLIKDTGA
jgi:hypothetical protein